MAKFSGCFAVVVCMGLVSGCLASGDVLLGSQQCTDGPSYWCLSTATASQCNAFHFCMTQVWIDGEAPTTTAAATSGLDDVLAVDKMLEAQVTLFNPEQAMEALYSTMSRFAAESPSDDCDCEACEFIVTAVNSWLGSNGTQNAIHAYYNKLCTNVPASMQEHCVSVVGKHVMVLMADMANLDPKKTCKDWCSNSGTPKTLRVALPKVTSPEKVTNTCLCQVCQQVFQELAQEFGQKRFQNELVHEWQRLCTFLPDAQVAACNTTAVKYIPDMYSMMSHLDAVRTCNHFKFCVKPPSKSQKFVPTPAAVAVTTKRKFHIPCIGPYFDLTRRNEDGSVPPEVMEVAEAVGMVDIPDDDCECESCKYSYGQFAACFHRNATRNFINSFYRKICLDIPPSEQENCVNVVMKHFAELTLDLGRVDPDKACKKACQPQTKAPLLLNRSLLVTNTCLCQRCQQYIQEFTSLASQKQYQTEIVTYYVQLCHFLKDNGASDKCKTEAKEYLPEFLDMLANLSPVQTCNHFKYCQKPE